MWAVIGRRGRRKSCRKIIGSNSNGWEIINFHGVLEFLAGSQEVVARSDYSFVADSGINPGCDGRIGPRSVYLQPVLRCTIADARLAGSSFSVGSCETGGRLFAWNVVFEKLRPNIAIGRRRLE